MSSDLFKAILAMDAYNMGYNEGIKNLGGEGSQIGNATILRQSDIDPNTAGVNAGFYAIAYKEADGSTIISYRGTDNEILSLGFLLDLWQGYGIGGGNVAGNQAALAFQFYNSIASLPNVNASSISLTGHSLGGGLAGLVGANTNNPVSKNLTFRKKCAA